MSHKVRPSPYEDEMIENLIQKRGYFNKADIYRSALRDLYRKEFPPYKGSVRVVEEDPLEKISDGDYCTKMLGGKIEGGSCVFSKGAAKLTVPLGKIKEY